VFGVERVPSYRPSTAFRAPCVAALHEVCEDPEGEPRIVVSEVVAQRLDVLAGAQQDRGAEGPESVHAVFACGLVSFARPRCGDDFGRDESGLPRAVIEVRPPDRARAVEASEQQPLGDEWAVRPEPWQRDLYRGNVSMCRFRTCATRSGKGTARILFRFSGANTRPSLNEEAHTGQPRDEECGTHVSPTAKGDS
jgi:hypothetical protein